MSKKRVAIIGAGPAGLTAAYLLAKAGQEVVIFERDPKYVGGISRTESYKGNLFDIGGHRFFSKSQEVEDFWTEILGDEMIRRPRNSRIFYRGKFFSYPLQAREALKKLGLRESIKCLGSYLHAKLFPVLSPINFEDWVSNHFGRRLFRIFFKTYTEKVWGIPCKEISADWASQRIRGLSLASAMRNAFFGKTANGQIKTLVDSFRYPRLGPGMMWEACAAKCQDLQAKLLMGCKVEKLYFDAGKWTLCDDGQNEFPGFDYVISSAPLKQLIASVFPVFPTEVLEAAKALCYRDFITVILILKDRNRFSDNWIYIHDPSVRVGRIQNFKSWSPDMVADPTQVCYGLEYFCFDGDGLWTSSDDSLIEMGKKELQQIGLAKTEDVLDGYVVRQKKAYPVYDLQYKQRVEIIKSALPDRPGLILVGRNGMHKYNNQDHSMMTAMLATRNILAGKQIYDLWRVNEDAGYHETDPGSHVLGRLVPQKI